MMNTLKQALVLQAFFIEESIRFQKVGLVVSNTPFILIM